MPPRRGRPPLPRRGRPPLPHRRGRAPSHGLQFETNVAEETTSERLTSSEEVQSNPPNMNSQQEDETGQEEGNTQSVQAREPVGENAPQGGQPTLEEMLRAWFTATMNQGQPQMPAIQEPIPSLGKFVKELKSLGCWTFDGIADPEEALHWLDKVQSTLGEAEIPEPYRVRAVAQLLEKSAHDWWGAVKVQFPPDRIIQWEEFRSAFDEQYYTRTMRQNKETEFLQLKQGTLTVLEYQRRFQELSRFAVRVVSNERERIDRFVEGLRPEVRGAVVSMKAMGRPMQEIMETAQSAERTYLELKGGVGIMATARGAATSQQNLNKPKYYEKAQTQPHSKQFSKKRDYPSSSGHPSRGPFPRKIPKFLPCPLCK